MAIEHRDITDPEIHEPKGVAAASSGSVYVADGASSGSWERYAYGCSSLTADSTAQTSTSGTFQVINATNFSAGTLTWANNQAGYGLSFNITDGGFSTTETGVFLVTYSLSFSGDDASSSEFQMTIGIDTGSGVVSKEVNTTSYRGTTAAGVIGYMGGSCMPTLNSGDTVYVMIRRNSGTADLKIRSGNFTVHRVA